MAFLWLVMNPVAAAPDSLFGKHNLVAWCIVPFDSEKRSPEERAAMAAELGLIKIAYDWREEHVPGFEREILAYRKHGIEFFAFWGVHEEALRLFRKYQLSPQLWVTVNPKGGTQKELVKNAASILLPTLEKAKEIGSKVGIYNHGGWGGEPGNMVAVCEYLRDQHRIENIGIVYNLHHGHSHLAELPDALQAMKPWLLCLNLNGMDIDGDAHDRKILPLGVGTQDVKVLRQIRASGFSGPVGILNHTQEDARGRLLDNLDGLHWLLPQLDDNPPGPKPEYRTWEENSAEKIVSGPVDSFHENFGKALKGGWLTEGSSGFRVPFTVECRAMLNSNTDYNILIAHEPKNSPTHWELYTHKTRGSLAFYIPGHGGDYDSKVDICDGKWHDLVVSIDNDTVRLWIDGKMVREIPVRDGKLQTPKIELAGANPQLAFGRLVEGQLHCDGLIDDARISRGLMKPGKKMQPRERLKNTLGIWNFDE